MAEPQNKLTASQKESFQQIQIHAGLTEPETHKVITHLLYAINHNESVIRKSALSAFEAIWKYNFLPLRAHLQLYLEPHRHKLARYWDRLEVLEPLGRIKNKLDTRFRDESNGTPPDQQG